MTARRVVERVEEGMRMVKYSKFIFSSVFNTRYSIFDDQSVYRDPITGIRQAGALYFMPCEKG